jgi:hypothetical protein
MGVIDPVLEMDWSNEFQSIEKNPRTLFHIVSVVNQSRGDYQNLIETLKRFDEKSLSHLAMLVAKELVGFHSNKTLH